MEESYSVRLPLSIPRGRPQDMYHQATVSISMLNDVVSELKQEKGCARLATSDENPFSINSLCSF